MPLRSFNDKRPNCIGYLNLANHQITRFDCSISSGSRRGLTARYSGYGNSSTKDQRPSSLRLRSHREREDIRFFFKPDETSTLPEPAAQSRNMANITIEKRRSKSEQHQSEYDRYVLLKRLVSLVRKSY